MSYPMTNFINITSRAVGSTLVPLPPEPEPVFRSTMDDKIRTTANGSYRIIVKSKE